MDATMEMPDVEEPIGLGGAGGGFGYIPERAAYNYVRSRRQPPLCSLRCNTAYLTPPSATVTATLLAFVHAEFSYALLPA